MRGQALGKLKRAIDAYHRFKTQRCVKRIFPDHIDRCLVIIVGTCAQCFPCRSALAKSGWESPGISVRSSAIGTCLSISLAGLPRPASFRCTLGIVQEASQTPSGEAPLARPVCKLGGEVLSWVIPCGVFSAVAYPEFHRPGIVGCPCPSFSGRHSTNHTASGMRWKSRSSPGSCPALLHGQSHPSSACSRWPNHAGCACRGQLHTM